MEHARKMILVPAEAGYSHQHVAAAGGPEEKNSVLTPGTPISRLDAEMSEILNSNNFRDEREKCILYQQALQRFLRFKTGIREQESLTKAMQKDIEEEKAAAEFDKYITETVPAKFREKAQSFLAFARKTESIAWDANGRVSVHGELLPDSNIVDLVNDAMRGRKHFRAAGRRQFCAALRAAGIPQDYIGNQAFWRDGIVVVPSSASLSATSAKETSRRLRQQRLQQQQQTSLLASSHSLLANNNSTFKDAQEEVDDYEVDDDDEVQKSGRESHITSTLPKNKRNKARPIAARRLFQPAANSSMTWSRMTNS